MVYLYEKFLYHGPNKEQIENNPDFWEEFFLLQPNVEILEAELLKLNSDNLSKLFYANNSMLNEIKKYFSVCQGQH